MRRRGVLLLLSLTVGLAVLGLSLRAAIQRKPPSTAIDPTLPAPFKKQMMGVATVDPLGTGQGDERPRRVYVGVYAFHVPHLDLMNNSYLIDFWIWFRWHGEDIDPSKTFEFMNQYQGWEVMRQPVYSDEEGRPKADPLGNGWFYQCFHVQTRFGHPFDVRRYPFDRQELIIAVEDTDQVTSQMVYVPDEGTTAIDAGLDIPGWTLSDVTAGVSEAVYPTNWGDPRRPVGEDRYTRFSYIIHIERPVIGYLATTLLPISIVVLMTFAAFMIPLRFFEGRLSLAVTSLISAVALQLTSSGDLPKTGFLVLLDHVYNIAYLMILLTTVETIYSLYLHETKRVASSQALDRWALGLGCLTYFGSVAALVFSAV